MSDDDAERMAEKEKFFEEYDRRNEELKKKYNPK